MKAGCCLLPPNMGLLLKGDPSAFSSGFYCTKRAEQHSNSDCTLPSSSPTLLYALGAISAGKRQALASKQFVVLKFGHFWPMFRKREAPSTGRTMDGAAPFWHTHSPCPQALESLCPLWFSSFLKLQLTKESHCNLRNPALRQGSERAAYLLQLLQPRVVVSQPHFSVKCSAGYMLQTEISTFSQLELNSHQKQTTN